MALDPKTDAVLSTSQSLADAERQAIEEGTEPVMEFAPESDGYLQAAKLSSGPIGVKQGMHSSTVLLPRALPGTRSTDKSYDTQCEQPKC